MSKQANLHTIQLCSLSIGYAGKKQTKVVAQDINASIHGGELTCLLGANGAGKSTLLRTLSAFQPKLNGQTRVMGKEIGLYTDKELATIIGVVLTDRCDVRNMTVEELVGMGRSPYTGFWGRLRGRDREIVKESISLVKIENLTHRMVHTLSDGERQKVMIAKVLAQETPVISRLKSDKLSDDMDPEALSDLITAIRNTYRSLGENCVRLEQLSRDV